MAKIDLSPDELTLCAAALKQAVQSAQRAQKNNASPTIVEVYKTHEATLQALQSKLQLAANTKQP